jgi:predicted phage terminase large subunit-like protein
MTQTTLDAKTIEGLHALPMADAIRYWDALEQVGRDQNRLLAVVRALCQADLYYLLVRACKRADMLCEFAYARCREVEKDRDGRVDLWAREHFKSSVITFGLTIQDILRDPNITFGLFSHTRPIAKAFLRQIMREFEENETLHAAFPDILWGRDIRAAPKWSEDDGIIVRRTENPKEATIEACGLVDGQPTSKHFKVLLYDDVVVQASVTTPEQIEKTMTALEQSYNLGVTPGGKRRMVGTRWHFNDAHRTVVDRGTFIPREHPGKKGGTEDGESVHWPEEIHDQKRRDMGPYTYAAQILLNPKADSLQGFKRDWVKHYKKMPATSVKRMNGYILVDAASSKKKGSDYTSMWVVGLNVDRNRYALDMVRDRLNLKERGDRLFALHRKWSDSGLRIKQVRYERYGLMADIEHLQARMEDEGYRFQITEVGGVTSKADRIKRLLPIFEQGQMWLPENMYVTDWQKTTVDLVRAFIEEEYMAFPVGMHDDMLDALARMEEPDKTLVWPKEYKVSQLDTAASPGLLGATGWLGA